MEGPNKKFPSFKLYDLPFSIKFDIYVVDYVQEINQKIPFILID